MKIKLSFIRRKFGSSRNGHSRIKLLLPIAIILWVPLSYISWMSSKKVSQALMPPSPPERDITHFRNSRSLRHYLDNIQLLIEPSALPCSNLEEVKVLVLVASTPSRVNHRQAIRLTWGRALPTYFILGLDNTINDDLLIDNYVEAKQYSDMVVFDFKDHYQNLTLKTSLMLLWSSKRCPQAQFVYKNDDDTIINPWVLEKVLKERGDAKILGYVKNNSIVHRDEHNKWFMPRWLYPEDIIPQYATGPGYLINGDHVSKMLAAATTVPLHNMEDVFFTYNVAKKKLKFALTHDERLSPYRQTEHTVPGSTFKLLPSYPLILLPSNSSAQNCVSMWRPIIPLSCSYWRYASIHSLKPGEIIRIWTYIRKIGQEFADGLEVCKFYGKYLDSFVTYTW